MPPGRPRKTDPQDVLDRAMKLFWEKGYKGTSFNDLVQATGMAKPGLYATFGDKQQLYEKALTYYFEDLGSPLLEDMAHSSDDLKTAVRKFLEAVIRNSRKVNNPNGCFVVNSLLECADGPEDMAGLARKFDQQRRDVFVTRFLSAQKNHELPASSDPIALADFFASQSLSLAVMSRAGNSRETIDHVLETALSLLPDGPQNREL
ncbi:TetR/AcrR family transcriptional regulator [Rhodovibrionaceae bacterium A322]